MKKHLFYTLAVAALLGACSQDDFQVPANVGEEGLNNDFAQYVGVPYEGEIGFSKGDDAQTRMVLDDDLAFQWQKGDEVGLVWMNSDAISNGLSDYKVSKESVEVGDRIKEEYGNDVDGYVAGVKSGDIIPYDDSYVWGLWPTNWKTFSNTRMTYDGTTWHMTDGQVYKGMYMAYFPLDESRQSTSKFTVTQNAEQAQNATTYTNAEDAKNTISNHILSTVPGEGLVWISENDGDVSTNGATQHSSFLYRLSEQNIESGKADKINIRMRPFSDIFDLRINIHAGTMDAAVAKNIKVTSVELKAQNDQGKEVDKFPTEASFSMNAWGSNSNPNGVYGTPSQLDGPYYYTWNVSGTDNATKYVPAGLTSKVKTTINNPAANNGTQQRVQMMLLPWNYTNASAALGEGTKFVVRVNTDYGYIDLPESTEWYYRKPGDTGLVVNPKEDPEAFGKVSDIKTKALAYALSYIGQRATRYVSFDASGLHYNDIDVCNTESLIEAITKWNQLGEKSGIFRVKQTEGCTFENLIWNNTSDNVVVKTQEMAAANQPDSEDIVLGAANEAIVTFLANGNTLQVEAYDGDVNLGGNSAIATENIEFISPMTLEEGGKLGITTDITLENGLNTEAGSKLYVSNERTASLTLGESGDATTGSSIWYGDLYLYQAGNILLDRYTNVDNYGTMHINGHFLLNGAAKLNNNVDAATGAAGDVRLYAYAELNGSQAVGNIAATQFNNNSTIHYVDMLRPEVGFWSTINPRKLTFANNRTVIAEITQENQANHAAAYLNAANDFGATDLLIKNATISKGEWNNLSALDSFKKVTLTNATWNVFKAINLKNAECKIYINGKVSIIGHNQEASFTTGQFILNAGSNLTVDDIRVHEETLTLMYNNTTLRGYDNFDKSIEQPYFKGNGKHLVYDSEGKLLFD